MPLSTVLRFIVISFSSRMDRYRLFTSPRLPFRLLGHRHAKRYRVSSRRERTHRRLSRLSRRDDREQQERPPAGVEMQGGSTAEPLPRPVARIVVQKRPAAFQLILEIRQPPTATAAIFVIPAADCQRHAIALRHRDGGGPELDMEFDRLARRERLLLVMGVIGPIGLAELLIELPVRG